MTEKKPERTLELHVDIDAPLEAAWKAITEGQGSPTGSLPSQRCRGKVSGPPSPPAGATT